MSMKLSPRLLSVVLSVCVTASFTAAAQTPRENLVVLAAGSLRAAMEDLARAFEQEAPVTVTLRFGPSGLLKERIEAGENAQVFASANMNHPQALLAAGKAHSVRPFARNRLCALGGRGAALQAQTLVQQLLDSRLRVGISTPRADPAGDYAFQLFDNIETSGAAGKGSASALKAKALQLAGGPNSPQPTAGRNLYGQLMDEGRADVFITYCTNAVEAKQQVPALPVLELPDAINVSAVYGMALVQATAPGAQAFVDFVTGPQGQQRLRTHGFSAP
jgi:molybdate transport system substrate-binding protein